MLVSGVQQSDSVIYVCIYINTQIRTYILYIYFFIFSVIVYYKILNRVLCSIQLDLVVYLFYMQWFIYFIYIVVC